jgi:hypothetical protein
MCFQGILARAWIDSWMCSLVVDDSLKILINYFILFLLGFDLILKIGLK